MGTNKVNDLDKKRIELAKATMYRAKCSADFNTAKMVFEKSLEIENNLIYEVLELERAQNDSKNT